jgi:hypothetical protein
MANYSQDFQSQAQGLLGLVKGKLSETIGWKPLPGQLNKIVASSGGFVWGFNVNGDFYTCREPCDGTNWKQVSRPPGMTGMPLDIAVDAQNVYVLYNAPVTPQETASASPGIQTGQIEIGDVGMPPGHITVGNGSVIISASFLGPNAAAIASSITKGTVYSATIKDDQGVTATFPITSVGTNPSWQGPPWVYGYSGSGGDSASVATKFAKSKTISLTLTGPPATTPAPTTRPSGLSFSMQAVDGSGSWSTPQTIPGSAPANPEINVTDQFIFVGSQGCSKPCTTGNWVAISGPPGNGQSMGIVAASSGSTYVPVNNGGQIKVYTGAGNGQGGWTPQPGLAGKIPIAVEADSQFLYAQDSGSGGVYRCSTPYSDPASCQLQDTGGVSVTGNHTISVNPRSYQTYLTASSGGQYGNIFQRLDEGGVNVAPIMEQAKKYTSQMDSDVNALGGAVSSQDAQLSAAKTRQEAVGIINQMTNISDDIYNKKVKSGTIRQKVLTDGPDGPSIYRQRMFPLQILLVTLLVVIALYFATVMFVSPTISMGISIGVLVVGTGAAIYYAV